MQVGKQWNIFSSGKKIGGWKLESLKGDVEWAVVDGLWGMWKVQPWLELELGVLGLARKAANVEIKIIVIYYGMSGLWSVSLFEFSVRK